MTVIDRFDNFGKGIDVYKNEMQKIGIKIIESTIDNEYEIIKNLPKFDSVISMAVIEHVPHTPKYFLEAIISKIKKNGLIALDTPNINRYWNRKAFDEGRSSHQKIENQFYSKIPYEGHHREYTLEEMEWMLKQLNIKDIKTKMFDYNIFQFKKIEDDHLEALLEMICNYKLKDTILVTGRIQ